jgi:hypothetical protein
MDQFKLLFDISPWLIVPSVLIGLGYAFLLYSKRYSFPGWLNSLLFAFRTLLVALICFLLLGPSIQTIRSTSEKPIVIMLVDNSQSMVTRITDNYGDSILSGLSEIKQAYEAKDLNVEIRAIDGSEIERMDSISFDGQLSNLARPLEKLYYDYRGLNLAEVLLLSDGIYNRGISPEYQNLDLKINTVGTGDTVPLRDVSINGLKYNRVSYQGNRYPVEVQIVNEGYGNNTNILQVLKNGREIEKRTVELSPSGFNEETFLLNADSSGYHTVEFRIEGFNSEKNKQNNVARAYVEVVEGKENILIAAPAPHPDIKALNAAISENQNYEVEVFIPGINDYKSKKYDLVIFHSYPSRQVRSSPVLDSLLDSSMGKWFIVGTDSDLKKLESDFGIGPGDFKSEDLVTGAYNAGFSKFRLSENSAEMFTRYPPVVVPFGNFPVPSNFEILLNQRVGNLETSNPLLALGLMKGTRMAVFAGTGIWRWRLNDYYRNDETGNFDQMVLKIVQFLSTKEDKRKFRVYPSRKEYFENEVVQLVTELYNDLYEPVYGVDVELTVENDSGFVKNYNYQHAEISPEFNIQGLPTGRYGYTARTRHNNRNYQHEGIFIIKDLNPRCRRSSFPGNPGLRTSLPFSWKLHEGYHAGQ